ncbi:hypothetical protein BHE74_00010574 [Ensete ventricosum]|nr:hypothetical protein BHE74_00010574 [Ensete ventricosum]
MIVPTEEPKREDTTLEPKEKDTQQSVIRTVPTLAGYTNLQKFKIKGFLGQQSVIILIDAWSTHNFMSTKLEAFEMRMEAFEMRMDAKLRALFEDLWTLSLKDKADLKRADLIGLQ